LSFDLVPLFVDGAVVPATEQRKIRERGGATLRPVTDVMALTERQTAARETTGSVSMVERSPYRRGNRAGAGADFHQAPVCVVAHHDPTRVARQAPGRFRGNVRTVLEGGLAGPIGIPEDRRVDVDHHLISLARGARIDAVVEGRLREERQRVRLLLGHCRCFRGNVFGDDLVVLA
jgi:hypothetical protein